jgi:hypothetical protein
VHSFPTNSSRASQEISDYSSGCVETVPFKATARRDSSEKIDVLETLLEKELKGQSRVTWLKLTCVN